MFGGYNEFFLKFVATIHPRTVHDEDILTLVAAMDPITLAQMKDIKLMNRTDTKFVTSKAMLVQLLYLAKDDYYSQEHAGQRVADYKTVYWDTDQHIFFMQHHNGHAPRQKVRVRTYMDSLETFLEIKTKNNHKRTKKKRISVPSQEDLGADAPAFVEERTRLALNTLHPCLQNRFHRITLVNRAKTERLTIDFDVQFKNFESHNECGTGDLVIIELKRDGNVPSPVLRLLNQLRIKPSGFSKYCIGSCMTNSALKQNRFKPKLQNVARLVRVGGGLF